jgi:tetratricopeptide (TPR) repeat protein
MSISPPKKNKTLLLLIATSLFIGTIFCVPDSHAARRRHSGPSGGVYLQTPEPQTPDEHNNRGVELGNKGLWQDAIREHETALKADPTNATYRTNLSAAQLRYGDYLANQKKYYEASKQYRGALYVDPNNGPADEHLDACLKRMGKNPDDPNVRRGMGDDADTKGDWETAIVEFNKLVKMVDNGPSHKSLGTVYHKAGKDVEAFKELKKALVSNWDTKDPDYIRGLGDCHRELGDILLNYAYTARDQGRMEIGMKRLLNAGTEFRRAVTINPNDSNAIRGLIETAREAVSIKPKSFDNHLMLGGAYQLGGDFDRAKDEYEKAWKINPEDYRLAKAQRSFWTSVVKSPTVSPQLLNATVQKVERAVHENQSDAELLYIYGRGKEAQGDRDMAMAAYNRARSIDPYVNTDLAQRIAVLSGVPVGQQEKQMKPPSEEELAKQEKARKAKEEALAKEEAAKKEAIKAQQAFAEIERKMSSGDLNGAQTDLLAAVDKNHNDAHAWLLLGNTQEKMGRLDEAAVSYRQASFLKDPAADGALRQINTSRVQPMLQAADKSMKEGNTVAAAASLREAASIAPNLPLVHRKLAEVLRLLGDTKEADREMKKAQELEKT